MADFLDEIAQYLDDQGVGEYSSDAGRSIFVGDLPASPDALISIYGIVGSSLTGGNRQVPTLQFPRFQVLVRDVDYALASAKLQAVRAALHAKNSITLPSWRVMSIFADQEGGPIGKDGNGRFEFSINFSCELNAESSS